MLYDKRWEPKVPAKKKWQQVLLDAADLIEHEGWTRGSAYNWDGDKYYYCAIGAILSVRASWWSKIRAYRKLRTYVRIQNRGASVVAWNDRIAIDKAVVINTMKRVASHAV